MEMTTPLYTIRREQKFVANLAETNQCGKVGAAEFRVSCEICATELDEQSFVIDQFKLRDHFDRFKTGKWLASCEALAGGFIIIVHRLMGGRVAKGKSTGGRAHSIRVRIHPVDEASVEIFWKRGMPLPHVFPKPAPAEKPKLFRAAGKLPSARELAAYASAGRRQGAYRFR